MTHNQHVKGTHVPEIEILFSKRAETWNHSRISDPPLHNSKDKSFPLTYIIRLCYLYWNIKEVWNLLFELKDQEIFEFLFGPEGTEGGGGKTLTAEIC